jgi:DnaJ-class molecular chaperone with C-terminal Zn finger domain
MKLFSVTLLIIFLNILQVLSVHREYYDILEVTPQAKENEIKKAYRRLSQKYHPDRNPGDEEAHQKFLKIAQGTYAIKVP